jgi:hypothetical protein
MSVNVAVTDLFPSIVTVHVRPAQSPDHPVNVESPSAIALSVTDVPGS